jgi:hypothetical protein
VTRQQYKQRRDDLVKRLFEEGKSHREIAKIARISLRDIGPILTEAGLEYSYSMSSRAYGMYADGMSPLEVAMALNIREPEATKFHLEYLGLNLQNELLQIFYRNKNDLLSIVKLHKLIKDAKMDTHHVLKLLIIANNNLPNLEHKYETLKEEVDVLESERFNLQIEIRDLHDRIINLSETLSYYPDSIQKEEERLRSLNSERIKIESAVEKFKDSNELYLHIEKTVEEKLSNKGMLLRYSLLALADSIRSDPDKYAPLLFYDNKDAAMTTTAMSNYYKGYAHQHELNSSLNYSRNDYIDMLMEVSEKLLSMLLEVCIEDIITESSKATSPSPYVIFSDDKITQEENESDHRGSGKK